MRWREGKRGQVLGEKGISAPWPGPTKSASQSDQRFPVRACYNMRRKDVFHGVEPVHVADNTPRLSEGGGPAPDYCGDLAAGETDPRRPISRRLHRRVLAQGTDS